MNLLSVENVSKSFGERVLFEKVSFGINWGNKVALVARNGSGKSSLLKIIAGNDSADEGKISRNKDVRFGYLEQDIKFNENLSVLDNIFLSASPEVLAIKEYERVNELYEENHADEHYQSLQKAIARIEDLKAWDHESRVKQVLGKLGIKHFDQTVKTLSGGQKRRLALARVLIEDPQFLILDEPTNHLDIEMIEWLESYLSRQNISLLLVTHDRYFLENICDSIIELDNNRLYRYEGNYEKFVEQKANRTFNEESEHEKLKNRYRKELEWVRKMPKARTSKSKSRVDAFSDIEEKVKSRKKEEALRLEVKMNRIGGKVLELKKVYKQYGENVLLKGFDYTFKKGERIGVVGKNGSGKTTFLNLITENDKADSGKINVGETIVYGYFNQDGIKLDQDKRVIEVVKDIAEFIPLADGSKVMASQFLQMFGFPLNQHFTFVSSLSGGEKRRLHLLTILVKNPNFLVLDEPTNDLDLITLQALEEFLENFTGCLVIVTHDRYFMDKLVDQLFIFHGKGDIQVFPGNYTEYRNTVDAKGYEREIEPEEIISAKPETIEKSKIKLTYKERLELEKLNKELEKLEEEKIKLTEVLQSGISDHEELMKSGSRLSDVIELLEQKGNRWLELSAIEEQAK
ncbi:MAG: ABC-F family ATP-binding cassette domain-containing protein [Bacteroidota bacterium]